MSIFKKLKWYVFIYFECLNKPRFRLGQVWEDRSGNLWVIEEINRDKIYGIKARYLRSAIYFNFTSWGYSTRFQVGNNDLVRLA
jgi:hypothetical protein